MTYRAVWQRIGNQQQQQQQHGPVKQLNGNAQITHKDITTCQDAIAN